MKRWLLLALLAVFCTNIALAEEDLEKDLRDLQQQAESLLTGLQKGASAGAGAGSAQLDVARRKVFTLASDQRFLQAMNAVWASPHRNELFVIDLIFVLFVVLIRAWRQSRARNWFTRLLVGFFCAGIMWAGLAYAIPALVLGEPYRIMVARLWFVIFNA